MTKITGFSSEYGGIVTYEGFNPPTQEEVYDYKKEQGIVEVSKPTLPGFYEMIRDDETLQRFTAPPKDGDYDWHIMCAMRAVYRHMKKIMEEPT